MQPSNGLLVYLNQLPLVSQEAFPLAPHALHLIAEATLIPIDNSMKMSGLEFIRYADDIVVLCDSEKASKTALSRIASILDKQQRLMIQRHKTKFYKPEEFQDICREMIEDRPIDKNEEKLLKIINKYTKGDRYKTISYNLISPSDWTNFSSDVVEAIIKDYLSKDDIDYIRLRWFYRRLAQVGHPGAVSVSIENIEVLQPCLANICFYISSVQSIEPEAWKQLGESLIKLLEKDEIKESEFFSTFHIKPVCQK